jgi:hypothetical protein
MKQRHRDRLSTASPTDRSSPSSFTDMLRLSRIPEFVPKDADVDAPPTQAQCLVLAATIFWGFVELPFELLAAQASTAAALLLIEALVSASVALLTLQGITWARCVFAILCGTSITVIVFSFATDMRFYPVWFALSLVELITKVGAPILVCRKTPQKDPG